MSRIVRHDEFDVYDECRSVLHKFHRQIAGHRFGVLSPLETGKPAAWVADIRDSLLKIDIEARLVDTTNTNWQRGLNEFPGLLICDDSLTSNGQFHGYLETCHLPCVGSDSGAIVRASDRLLLSVAMKAAGMSFEVDPVAAAQVTVPLLEVSDAWLMLPTVRSSKGPSEVAVLNEAKIPERAFDIVANVIRLVRPNGFLSIGLTLDERPVLVDVDLAPRLDSRSPLFQAARFVGFDHGTMLLNVIAECFSRYSVRLPTHEARSASDFQGAAASTLGTPSMSRYIANLKFEQWEGRLYLNWSRAEGGDQAFDLAMKRIEATIGPTSRSVQEFTDRCKVVFEKAGFQLFKG